MQHNMSHHIHCAFLTYNTMLNTILFSVLVFVCFVKALKRARYGLHILQLDGYKPGRYIKWVSSHLTSCFQVQEILIVVGLLVLVSLYTPIINSNWFFPLWCAVWVVYQLYTLFRQKKVVAKKPLVYTFRAKRLLGLTIGFLFVLATMAVFLIEANKWRILVFLFSELTIPILFISSNLILPIEYLINNWYLRDAKQLIKSLQPRVIGITGSYGKTSTKYILHQILSYKYNTLMTPDSYNTPMGICKVIRGDLLPEHEYFIVEMGAYKQGDIRELCDLTTPEIGILTAIGPQHLERFKSIENIAKAKYELIQALPTNGLAVFNNDNEFCSELADKTSSVHLIRYGVRLDNSANSSVRLKADKIIQTKNGLTFTISDQVLGAFDITTKLLGKHNASNILAAIAVSQHCGMTIDEIKNALKSLDPVPHRLQLLNAETGVTIIDDSFNANPEGAKAALEVLTDFVSDEKAQKVLVTPGLIELGEREYDENKKFGSEAAKVCDYVILVGPSRTTPILDGLKSQNYPEQNIYIANDLSDAQQQLGIQLKPGDVVLFENDLPDNYNETI